MKRADYLTCAPAVNSPYEILNSLLYLSAGSGKIEKAKLALPLLRSSSRQLSCIIMTRSVHIY